MGAVLLGLSALAGWQFDVPSLLTIVPGWSAMQPMTALSFVLSGSVLLLDSAGRDRLQTAILVALALLAGAALSESMVGASFGLDGVLFPAKVADQPLPFPGRMSEICCAEFLLFGAALWLAGRSGGRRYFVVVAMLGLTMSMVLLAGYLFGAPALATIGSYAPIAAHTALGLLVLFLGVTLAQPAVGMGRLLVSPRLGGVTARQILPFVAGLPIVVGLLVHAFTGTASRGTIFPLTLVLLMVGLALVVAGMARRLDDAVAALSRSEADFRAMQEASPFGTLILDPVRDRSGQIADFRHRYINPAAIRLMGADPAAWAPETLLSGCPLHADGSLQGIYRAVIETGQPMDREVRAGQGVHRRWFRVVAVKMDEGVAVSFFETTGQKEAERALARTEARHRAVVDTAVDAMVVIDERGIIRAMNRSAERIFGYSAAEALGRNVTLLMPETYAASHHGFIENYRRTGIARIIGGGRELEGRRRDGSVFPLELTIAEWYDGDERFFTGIMRDITLRQQAQNALKQSEILFRAVFEQAAVGIELVSVSDGCLTEVNRKLCTMLGYQREEMIGQRFDRFIHSAFVADERRLLEELLSGRRASYVREKPSLRKDGSVIWVRVTSSLTAKGSSTRIAIFEDITQQKGTMEELRATAGQLERALEGARSAEEAAKVAKIEAEQADLAKSRFLAAASHDLRQPVQAMMLLSEALSNRLGEHPAAVVVTNMQASLNALRMLLDGLLDVSRLDAGVVTADPQPVAVGAVIDRLDQEYCLRAKSKGLTLHTLPTRVWAQTDPVLFERILRNLLENALRYTKDGKVLLGCRRHGHVLRVYVADTGIGIALEDQQTIFQEFYQVGNFERDREKGLGLGLSIVKRLTTILGHKLSLVSEIGRGSCFTLDLPLVTTPAAAQRNGRSHHPPAAGHAATVLVVDDEAIVRESLGALLEDWGYQVVLTGAGHEAVESVAEKDRRPDLIIADYRLRGGETGVQVINAVRQVAQSDLPAIVLTGDTAPERIAEVQSSGFDIVHKPVAADRLKGLIRFALGLPADASAGTGTHLP